jgi:outer membrane protein assembly factor BamB
MKIAKAITGGLGLLGVVAVGAAGTAGMASAAPSAGAASAAPTLLPSGPVALSWALPGGNLENTRNVASPITSANVSKLVTGWEVPLKVAGSYGALASTPVVYDGVVYEQDLASNVMAISLTTGKLLWEHKYNSPDEGPNGVTVADGTVYGATETSAFALQAATGEQLWIKKLTRNKNEGIDMAPGYNDGTVYISTVPGNANAFYVGNGKATLWAMNAATGAVKWKWDEVQNLWSTNKKLQDINSGGGQWDPPSFDAEGNLYLGVANPGPWPGTAKYPLGSSRLGKNLYTDSIVKLNAKTGKVMWYYQLIHHDLFDWDMNNSPVLTTIDGKPAVIDAGKAGIVVAVNATTGKLLWQRPVGKHTNVLDDTLKTEHGSTAGITYPITVEPGDLGGVESQLASNGSTVFAAINNLAVKYTGPAISDQTFVGGLNSATGEMVAIDQNTGKILWDHHFKHSAYGAVSVTNDVAFTTTFDGTLWALSTKTGRVLWSKKLSAGSNSPVTIDGNVVITAGGFVLGKGQKAEIQTYYLPSA